MLNNKMGRKHCICQCSLISEEWAQIWTEPLVVLFTKKSNKNMRSELPI